MELLMFIISLYYLYHLLFLLFSLGLTKPLAGTPAGTGRNRLAVLVPAHNEENVIASSVRSILASRYPGNKFDVYVIADNCTDRTAELARAAGALVLERENKTLRGKQHALKWAFEQINLDEYDAVVILDADNHVDPGFLAVLDHYLAAGHRVIQGYVETKNPGDSWVTANYAYMFWYLCRLQMARTHLGLSAWLAGTGLCISTDVLRRVGWNVTTLVDDVEYTCQLLLAGERVAFAPGAVVYDQKPVGLRDSMKQRLRWVRGQTQVTLRYLPRLVWHVVRCWFRGDFGQSVRAFDGIMWVPMHLPLLTGFTVSLFLGGLNYLAGVLLSVPAFYLLPLLAERVRIRRAWTYLLTAGAFFFTWIPITAYGVVTCDQKIWWRTPH